ncbi:class III lanthipeptide [Stenotrophomonas sp. S39]|nr:class III lanthipeptide [Stenotrophomonas sp. S39]MBK0053072.1 class III lanthipeptide [Stenotrophomonas sp. S39]
MNRVLNLQRLALDSSVGLLGNSCSSSTHSCCNGQQQK